MGKTVQEKAERKVVTVALSAVAAGETKDAFAFVSSDPTWLVSAKVLTATGVTADASDYLTFSVLPYSAAGVVQSAAATADTTVADGTDITANVPFIIGDETDSDSGLDTDNNAVEAEGAVLVRVVSTANGALAAGAVAVLEFAPTQGISNSYTV